MESLFTSQFQWLWTIALGGALFFPVRQLIWALSVRKAERKEGGTDAETRLRLRNRARITAGLLCFVVSVLYMGYLFGKRQ